MTGQVVCRSRGLLCLSVLIVLLLSAAAMAATGEGGHVLVQLRWLHQFQFAGYYAALEKGYYRQAGLDVTLVEGGPGRNPIEEVLSGRAQYGAASNELLLARLRGKPVKILAVIFQQSPSIFLARKDSGIDSPQAMLGKRVMMMTGMDDAELLAIFSKEGINLDKIHRLPTSFNIEDLITGKTDVFNAYLTNEPYYLEQKGIPATIIRPSTYGIHFYGDSVFTSEEEVRKHPQRVKAFLQATLLGWQYAMDHPEEIIELILAKYSTKKTGEHLRYEAKAMRELVQPEMIQMGHMNPGRWQHMAETFAALGLLPKDFKLAGLTYDPSAERDLTTLLWVLGLVGGILMVAGVVAGALVKFNMRLRREVDDRNRAEQRFTTMAANVPGAIIQVRILDDNNRRYTYLSRGAEEFFGVEPEVVIREGRTLNWHPEDRERIERDIVASFAARASHDLVGRIILPDGEEKWVNLSASPNPQPGGEMLYDGFILDVTERKLAELEYQSSERKIKAMSQAVDDALVMLNGRGRVMFFNPAAERLFGYTAQEAMGMDFHAMAAPEAYRDQVRQGLETFARTGQGPVLGTTTEIEAQDRQGRIFPVEVTLSSFQVDSEWFAVGTVRDITERIKAEEAIKESEKRVRMILNSISTGIIVIDPQNRTIVDVNPVAEKMIGLGKEQIIGRKCHKFICPREENDCPIIDQGHAVDNAERILITAAGKQIPVLKTVTPVILDGKDHLLESFVDLSERKKMEEDLKESQQRLSLLVQSSPLGVIEWDLDFRVLNWNLASERIFGYPAENVIGRHATELIIPEGMQTEINKRWLDLIDQKDGSRSTDENITRDGTRIVCEWYNTPLINESGHVIGVASLVNDITQQKKVEGEIRQYMEELERFNRLTLGRELRMIELKEEVNGLLEKEGQGRKYKIVGQE
ncbi:MAG: PAS domain S-box protein [Proteobacteria bacterium]|nr:PAS domain S-box protein [Pseudomonadota bacterium]